MGESVPEGLLCAKPPPRLQEVICDQLHWCVRVQPVGATRVCVAIVAGHVVRAIRLTL